MNLWLVNVALPHFLPMGSEAMNFSNNITKMLVGL